MSQSKLEAAFALIADFKRGQILPGSAISDQQVELLRLLCEDLLPNERFSVDRLSELIEKIARADSEWNRRTQLAIDEIYVLREAGKDAEARHRQRGFLQECPSVWYKAIADSL